MKHFAFVLIMILLLTGCGDNSRQAQNGGDQIASERQDEELQTVLGGARDITLLIDPAPKALIGEEIIPILWRPLFPSNEEDVFNVRIPELEKFHFTKLWKNVILMFQLDQRGIVANEVMPYLSDEVVNQIQQDGIVLLEKPSVWSLGQTVFIIAARDSAAIKAQGEAYVREAVDRIELTLNQSIAKELYQRGLDKDIVASVEQKYGWTIKIPLHYSLYKESSDDQVVMFRFRERDPLIDRLLTVHWGDASGMELTNQTVRAVRDRIMGKYSEGDYVVDLFLSFEPINFDGDPGILMEGNWNNDKDTIGGPFRTYFFIDEATNTYYMVDYFVLAIGMKKEMLMRQLDVIARTFNPTVAE